MEGFEVSVGGGKEKGSGQQSGEEVRLSDRGVGINEGTYGAGRKETLMTGDGQGVDGAWDECQVVGLLHVLRLGR